MGMELREFKANIEIFDQRVCGMIEFTEMGKLGRGNRDFFLPPSLPFIHSSFLPPFLWDSGGSGDFYNLQLCNLLSPEPPFPPSCLPCDEKN
jgi:hypothetical protein